MTLLIDGNADQFAVGSSQILKAAILDCCLIFYDENQPYILELWKGLIVFFKSPYSKLYQAKLPNCTVGIVLS